MSTFLSLSDDDIELLNRQFGLKLTREEWNRRLTTTPVSYTHLTLPTT